MSSNKDEILGISKNNGVVKLGKIAPDILSRLAHNAENRLNFDFNLKDILPFVVVSTEFSDDRYKNICFIDTPGYDPSNTGNQTQDFNTAKEFLSNSSALLWLIACDASGGNITDSDIKFLNSMELENKKLYIVMNKADLRAQSDLDEVLENLKVTLEMEGIDYEGISLYSSANGKEYGYDRVSLLDFLQSQSSNRHSKNQESIMANLISVYQSYEKALVKKRDDNDSIFSVLHSITIEMAHIDDEENEEHIFKVQQYTKNLKSLFSSSYSDECKKLIKELKRAFIELKGSIDAIFGSVYDLESNRLTYKNTNTYKYFPIARVLTNKNTNAYKYFPKTKEELQDLVRDENIKLNDIDISAVSDLSGLFKNSTREDFSGIEDWDVSHVTNMSGMFARSKYFNADISSWDVSNVTDMSEMFYEATSFNQPLSSWDTSKVTDMSDMFDCSGQNPLPYWYK